MARPRKDMGKLRDILRLTMLLGLSGNQVEQLLRISRTKVQKCVKRAREFELCWSDIASLTDEALEQLLFPVPVEEVSVRSGLDWARIHRERKVQKVPLRLAWKNTIESGADDLSYSQFCRRYKAWLERGRSDCER